MCTPQLLIDLIALSKKHRIGQMLQLDDDLVAAAILAHLAGMSRASQAPPVVEEAVEGTRVWTLNKPLPPLMLDKGG
jgi:hypothetical protein